MNAYYKNKIAIVTGSASGIGREMCRHLSDLGSTIIAADIDKNNVDKIVQEINDKGGNAHSYHIDISDYDAFSNMVDFVLKKYQRIDFLFNNAGVTLFSEVLDMSLDHWDKIIKVNLLGVINGIDLVYKIMTQQGSGSIVNVASTAGLVGYPSAAAYASSKSAVLGLSQSLRIEAEEFGVNINVACPGYVDTGIYTSGTVINAKLDDFINKIPFKMISAACAAEEILKGTYKNKALIIFPFHAKFLWFVHRFFPFLIEIPMKKVMQQFRNSRKLFLEK